MRSIFGFATVRMASTIAGFVGSFRRWKLCTLFAVRHVSARLAEPAKQGQQCPSHITRMLFALTFQCRGGEPWNLEQVVVQDHGVLFVVRDRLCAVGT